MNRLPHHANTLPLPEPTLAKQYLSQAIEAYHQGNYRDALANCNLSLEASRDNQDAYRIRGLIWHKLGDMAKASQDMRKAVNLINSKPNKQKKASFNLLHLFW